MLGIKRPLLMTVAFLSIMHLGSMPQIGCAQNVDDLPWHLSVKVVSESGEALSGVMFLEDLEDPDADGHYVIRFPPNKYRKYELIRFSLNGYIPVTKVVERGTPKLDVVLRKGENKWIPKQWPPSEETHWIGWELKILIPPGTIVKESSGMDTFYYFIFYGAEENNEKMQIASGPLYGLPWPSKEQLLSSSVLKERDMACRNGVDYQGRDSNGLRWRVTGIFNEVIEYEDVSDEAADFFDKMIDGLRCKPVLQR